MSRIYYHVDRVGGRLVRGQILGLVHGVGSEGQAHQTDVAQRYRALFPTGVSYHGFEYLLNGQRNPPGDDKQGTIEFLCEMVRRSDFAAKSSRFQSVFAFLTVGDALRFAEEFPSEDEKGARLQATIWEVSAEVEPGHMGDMRLLRLGENWLTAWTLMHGYWQGGSGANPMWEVLLSPPVRVLGMAAKQL